MKIASSRFPTWSVDIDEISLGIYRLLAVSPLGSQIDLTDYSPSVLLGKFESAAEQMDTQIAKKIIVDHLL